jgi:hypothetical protein
MATQQLPRGTKSNDGRQANRSDGQSERNWKDAPEHYSETPDWKDGTTKFLGWFSIGLGLAELFAPRSVAKLIGIEDEDEYATTLRTFGVREIAAGVGLLTRPKPTYWLWSRVGGDAIDLAFLGRRMRDEDENNNSAKLLAATFAVLGVTALDIMQGAKLTSEKLPATGHDEGSFQLSPADDGTVRRPRPTSSGRTSATCRGSWDTSSRCG